MGKEIITFGNTEIEKYIFHHYKNPIFLEDIDTNNILISNKLLLVKKIINTLLITWMMITKLSHASKTSMYI